jgi:WD40 repeat protein
VAEVKVVKGIPEEWDAYSKTIFLEDQLSVLACSGDIIAVGLGSNGIVILDAISGSCKSTLSGHTDKVTSLAFSPDRALLVSGSIDKSVKLWDVQTGGAVKTFRGHHSAVLSVSISSDSTIIASGSQDGTISLWNVRTGKLRLPATLCPDPRA